MSGTGGFSAAIVPRRNVRAWLAGLAFGMTMMAAAPVAAAAQAASTLPGTDIAAGNRALVRGIRRLGGRHRQRVRSVARGRDLDGGRAQPGVGHLFLA